MDNDYLGSALTMMQDLERNVANDEDQPETWCDRALLTVPDDNTAVANVCALYYSVNMVFIYVIFLKGFRLHRALMKQRAESSPPLVVCFSTASISRSLHDDHTAEI